MSRPVENTLLYAGIGLVTAAVVVQYLVPAVKSGGSGQIDIRGTEDQPKSETSSTNSETQKQDQSKPTSESSSWFSDWFARNFYDGGFEEKMTKREAALILGIRESATPERVKEAHRRILLLNHPDKGGSAYLAAKINEAKDLYLKGR